MPAPTQVHGRSRGQPWGFCTNRHSRKALSNWGPKDRQAPEWRTEVPPKAWRGDHAPPATEGTQDNYMLWTGHCPECSAIWKILLVQGNYPLCKSVWCNKCNRESLNNHFPRLDHHQSGSDQEVDSAYTQNRYQCGRESDHLMGLPFKCNLCSFRNVVGRDPVDTDARDEFTLTAIQRILLDAMWAQELDRVASNWSRLNRDVNMAVARSCLAPKGLTSTSDLDVINFTSVRLSFYSKI
jgi:hypothetical protein